MESSLDAKHLHPNLAVMKIRFSEGSYPQGFFSGITGFKDVFPFIPLSRRDSAHPDVRQVGTPSLGKSHWVRTTHPTTTAINQTHCGIFYPLLGSSSPFYPNLWLV